VTGVDMIFLENHNGHFELQHALSKVWRHFGLHKSLLYIEKLKKKYSGKIQKIINKLIKNRKKIEKILQKYKNTTKKSPIHVVTLKMKI
jgi:hypothetical protein